MAHLEPMDIDSIESDYEDKENSILHSNVLPRTPCTEKGYEELDVSELNMKLRYSITPASSPMSRSFTANCKDGKNIEDKSNSVAIGNACLTSSFNTTLTNDSYKTSKVCPLQPLPADQLNDTNRNVLVQRSLDTDVDNNITITVSDNVDENFSIPSTSSSIPHTPEATTPTKELPKEGGSPIMRGLRSVLSIFRPSQSPIPPHEPTSQENVQSNATNTDDSKLQPIQVSTPLHKINRSSPKRNSPLKESLVFNDDLEKELQWKDESTILFKEEKIPKHKLLLQESVASNLESKLQNKTKEEYNKTVEYMDISYNDSIMNNKTMIDIETKTTANNETCTLESDGEFVDCETTYSKVENESKTEDTELKQNNNEEVDVKSNATQNSIYIDNNYSLNITVPIEPIDKSISMSKEVKDSIDITATKEETIDVNNVISSNDSLLKDNSFTTSEDRSLCGIELPDNLEINNLCDSKMTEQAFDAITCNNVTSNIAINEVSIGSKIIDCGPVEDKNMSAKITSIQNVSEHINNELISESYKNVNDTTSYIVDKSLASENNVIKDNNILNRSNIQEIGSDIIKATINNGEIEDNDTAAISDTLLASDKEVIYNKLDQCDLDQKELTDKTFSTDNDTHETEANIVKDSHLSLKDECNKTQDLNVETNQTTNLLSNISNMTDNVSSECNEETISSILYNENRYFRISIETEIPVPEILKYKEYENNQTIQTNDESSCQNSIGFDKSYHDNLSKISIIKQNQDTLENIDCSGKDKSEQFGDSLNQSKIRYDDIRCADITETKQDMELPINIPLPSDNELDQDVIDKCHINYSSNSENQLDIEPESYVSNQNTILKTCEEISDTLRKTPIENIDSISDLLGEVNNKNSELTIKNVVSEEDKNLITSNKFEEDNTIEGDIQKCGISPSEEVNKSGIIDPRNNNLIVDANLTKTLIKTDNEQMQTLNLIETPELNKDEISGLHLIKDETVSSEKSCTKDLSSDIKVDSVVFTEELSNPIETNNLQISAPLSPLIQKKGYDINFDDIDDPFATKTKIRQSPTPETPKNNSSLSIQDSNSEKSVTIQKRNIPKNKRKSQPMRKSVNTNKNFLNATFDCDIKKDSIKNDLENDDEITILDTREVELMSPKPITDLSTSIESRTFNKSDIVADNGLGEENNSIKKSEKNKGAILSSDSEEPPSPKNMAKSVFNCPEINDEKFHSFSDRQRTALSNSLIPSADSNIDDQETFKNPSITLKTDAVESIQAEDKHEEKSTCINNEMSLSRNTDTDTTLEVNTEDEDTVTFVEMEEFVENDNIEKLSNEKDMMKFEVPHSAINNENIDERELFIDAEAFEFLLNQNKSNTIADSGKESLFLKFDPLFAKRVSSDGIIAALKKVQNKQSTPKKLTKLQSNEATNLPGPSKLETTFDDGSDDVQAMSKPMMVVNPAVNSIVLPRKVSTPKINRQSLTFTSPAMAVIDRLLSLSANNSIADQNTPASSPSRQHNETDLAITQLREMLADKDIHVHNLRSESKELKDRLSSLEAQVKTLETESAERLRKVNDLSERLVEKSKMNKDMAIVVEEYERTIVSLMSQIEQEKKSNAEERAMLIKERDEQTAHLVSMEVSFSDLHSKYEKSKQIIYSMKSNEDTYRKSIKEFEESLVKMQNNYELLKQHATSKLNHANQELEKFNRAHEAEILKLNALIKRKELHITSLEETLTQKTKANEELTAICDELINKVG